jgi:hypothetical protein
VASRLSQHESVGHESSSERRLLPLQRVVLAAFLLLGCGIVAHAQEPADPRVKASYLYNFARFIEWPRDVLTAETTFNICIVGAEALGVVLDQSKGERVEGHEIAVRRVDRAASARAAHCHLLFLGGGRPSIPGASVLSERGLLTVGESPGFAERGGIINLVEVHGRIRFEINHKAAQRAGLVMSSRLLELAETK